MDLTLASLFDVVDRLGWTGGRTDLLTYPEYVIFKGIDTIIDEKRIRLGLKLNVYAPPFDPKTFTQITERPNNNNLHHNMKQPPTKNVQEERNTSKKQNKTLQENEQFTKSTKQEEEWKSMKNGIKHNTYDLERKST